MIAKHYLYDQVTDMTPTTGGVTMQFQHVTMSPGVYLVGGQSWNCTQPGLYVFKVPSEPYIRRRIVAGSPLDVYGLISGICNNFVPGSGSEVVGNLQPISDAGRFVVWSMRCGYIGNYAAWLLPQYGLTVRQVGVRTLETPNGYDDGHQVLEVYLSGAWRMFDLTSACYYRDALGNHMSTAQFITAIAGGAPMPERFPLAKPNRAWSYDSVSVPGGLLDLGSYCELTLSTPAQKEAWARRIFQALEPA